MDVQNQPKIGFFELEGWEEKLIRAEIINAECRFSNDKIEEGKIPAQTDFDAICIFVDSVINEKTLEYFPKLKFIATRSTGYDHIDLAACKKKGIVVTNVPGYGDNTVAEFAFGLLLTMTRKIYDAIDQVKETESLSHLRLRGIDLNNRTILVIGTGRIGTHAIMIAKGFSMNVIAFDPKPKPELATKLGFQYVSLEDGLRQADIVTIHCPLNDQTKHLLNTETMRYVKRGVYLVNTARGGIIETFALIEALLEGRIAGAALDVLEDEEQVKDEVQFFSKKGAKAEDLRLVLANHKLMSMPNVFITPHTAFNTQEALERILKTTLENIRGYMSGNLVHIVS
ncbi:MAG: Uncharacterized protein LiPW41_391 [Parcubacteria group bacterium LiPW_41]|nr:MAG: Uncharacterized protein LiPW41_391 [Parcubacteria group bacterium LiPW_41]